MEEEGGGCMRRWKGRREEGYEVVEVEGGVGGGRGGGRVHEEVEEEEGGGVGRGATSIN